MSKTISSKYHAATSKHQNGLQKAASHIKVTCPPYLFRLLPWENVNRSTI